MGAGGSVAHELARSSLQSAKRHHRHAVGPVESQYNEMMEHLRHRFQEEMDILRGKYEGVDQGILLARLIREELSVYTVEKDDLEVLASRPREGRLYVLGDSHFRRPSPSQAVVVTSLSQKALGLAGDEDLSTVAREALPPNARVNKKAVELMGSTKLVTEKKALKRLGSEMSNDMKLLQMKAERREQEEEERRVRAQAAAAGSGGPDSPTNTLQRNMSGLRMGSPLAKTRSSPSSPTGTSPTMGSLPPRSPTSSAIQTTPPGSRVPGP